MSRTSFLLDDALAEYYRQTAVHEPAAMKALAHETAALPDADMQSSPEAGSLLAMLVKLTGARRCFEVGTFTGYSALWGATALPYDGLIVALNVSEEWTAIGRKHWERAGVADKIELRLGPADTGMRNLLNEHEAGRFDFGFIDADKTGYPAYYELGLQLLRPGGLMVFDNMLRHGDVADDTKQDESTQAIRRVNEQAFADSRVEASLLLLGDGLLLVRKKD